MKTFYYNPINSFARKVYIIQKIDEQTTNVKVKSPFLGSWTFNINMDYSTLNDKLNAYSKGNTVIQAVFPNLTSEQREKFMSDPSMDL
jgi:ribosome recycling factor